MSRFKTLAVSALLAAGAMLPLAGVQAASLTSAQIQSVIGLLNAFGVDSTTIANVQATLSGVSVATSTANTGYVISADGTITASMIGYVKLGDSGDKVKFLQVLLSADPSVYPEGLVTGFFGPATSAAVKRFQLKHGLTAVGFVGPGTFKEIENELRNNPLATSTSSPGRLCAVVPPGHLIAPGWLKKNGNQMPVVPTCQTLPPGIQKKLGDDWNHGTTTPDTTAPVISAVTTLNVTSTGAMITWSTNEVANGGVEFGTTTAYGMTVLQSGAAALTHSATLTGLTASTMYHFRVKSADAAANMGMSSDMTFTTSAAADTTAPVLSSISAGTITGNSANVTWSTNEAANSKVYYSNVSPLVIAGAATNSDSAYLTSHTLALTSLATSTAYYYVVVSADSSGNTATSSETSFTTTN